MKSIFIIICMFFSMSSFAQQTKQKTNTNDSTVQIVEASCGECKFGLHGKSCDLAVRINGKAYFVDGTKIDSYGDAHAEDGFCNAIRKAEVKGHVENGRFFATYFKLLPNK